MDLLVINQSKKMSAPPNEQKTELCVDYGWDNLDITHITQNFEQERPFYNF